ncbi:chromate transporter [Sinomicrobium oceani]|uniref:Chromate transporter n=1 Tax=Sinomicrobium oceani TaxID=1150368 RepID=A0A1K1R5M3_9FLAO|nr:chromate transporter [Sinomicrobium oceani]SFW67217.1 chromate transporter [Sinomicrobium oceani]
MIMDLLTLIWVFFKIGLFSFGGGLTMVPLFIIEFEKHGWMTSDRFMDVLSLAQMTPGAIAMNSATYVGNSVAGVTGGVVATGALAAPSVIIMLLMSRFLMKVKEHPIKEAVFGSLKPVTIALIMFAGLQIGENTFFGDTFTNIRWKVIGIALFIAVCQYGLKKINPIFLIVLSAIAGVLVL